METLNDFWLITIWFFATIGAIRTVFYIGKAITRHRRRLQRKADELYDLRKDLEGLQSDCVGDLTRMNKQINVLFKKLAILQDEFKINADLQKQYDFMDVQLQRLQNKFKITADE